MASSPTVADVAESGSAPSAASPTRKQVLAAASPVLAALLNLLPGLGSGYLYQRRWRAYWITGALGLAWFLFGAVLAPASGIDGADAATLLTAFSGPLLLAAVTAGEAFLAGRRARMD